MSTTGGGPFDHTQYLMGNIIIKMRVYRSHITVSVVVTTHVVRWCGISAVYGYSIQYTKLEDGYGQAVSKYSYLLGFTNAVRDHYNNCRSSILLVMMSMPTDYDDVFVLDNCSGYL